MKTTVEDIYEYVKTITKEHILHNKEVMTKEEIISIYGEGRMGPDYPQRVDEKKLTNLINL